MKQKEIWLHYSGWSTYAIVLSFEDYFDTLDLGIYRKDDVETKDIKVRSGVIKALSHFHLGDFQDYPNWLWLTNYDKWSNTQWEDLQVELKLEDDLNYIVKTLDNFQL